MDYFDYIAVDRQIMIDFHGKYTFLEGKDKLTLFITENILIDQRADRVLTKEEVDYIKFRDDCYKYSANMELGPETLYGFFIWYSQSRRAGITMESLCHNPETSRAYNIVRYYLTAVDFQSHFRNFDPRNSDKEAYERDLAGKALRESNTVGKWLLRHSSRNRALGQEAQDRLGYRYYALSYVAKDMKILHVLITCKVGKGWSSGGIWYTNFLDALEATLVRNGLVFYQQISGYVEND